jgi:hypothetical protein
MLRKLFDFAVYDTGDWLSFVGLVLTLIGFGITFIGVFRAASAADRAQAAVANVREDIRRANLVATFTAAMAVMDEIKTLHRKQEWDWALLDRYTTIRRALVSAKSTNLEKMSDQHKITLQNSIQHFKDMEETVEHALVTSTEPPDIARLNRIVAEQADNVQEGEIVERVTAADLRDDIPLAGQVLEQLYEGARRQALNVDKTLDEILGYLNDEESSNA